MKYLITAAAFLVSSHTLAESHFELTSTDRVKLGLTVFNGNFAVLEDRRRVVLPTKGIRLEFADVARTIQPQTVTLQSSRPGGFLADQQNYRYDLLNRKSLLERFVGRKVRYARSLLEDGTYEKVLREGILLSINPEIVMFGDVIEIEPEGTISLPSLPSDLRTSPTLVFQGRNGHEGAQELSVRYHADSIGWEADYTLTLADKGLLNGWVTVSNRSGSDLAVDDLSLIAGEVRRRSPVQVPEQRAMMADMSAEQSVVPRAVSGGDYHRYEFGGPVNLVKNDLTQLSLTKADGIRVSKSHRLVSNVQRYAADGAEHRSPAIVLSFDNSRRNNLAVPLPAGTVRVFEKDATTETFIGEAWIDHTAAGGEIELEIGRAFNLSARRVQESFRRLGDRMAEVTYTITISNAGNKPATVRLEEKLFGDWEVVKQSRKGKRIDARTLAFEQPVPAIGESVLSYSVRLGW